MSSKIIGRIFIMALGFLSCFSATADSEEPYLYILGVAQDAGYPQTGCYEQHCRPGWEHPQLRRGAVSLGLIDPSSDKKYMFDASPNFPEQFYELEKEAPSSRYEFAGIFLTHAHIGHYTGLMFLGHEAMGAKDIPVYAMPKMSVYLAENGPWSQLVKYRNIVLKPLQNNEARSLGTIRVTPFLVPHRDEYSETVGYRIDGPKKSALFIPDINKWSQWQSSLFEMVETVDYALIDATFYADGELPGRDMSVIQHPFVTESISLLRDLPADQRKKVWFIHMNHTNPLLNAQSDETLSVLAAGYNIAVEGIRLGL